MPESVDNLFVRRCLPSNVSHLRNRPTDRRHSGFRAFFVRSIVFRHRRTRTESAEGGNSAFFGDTTPATVCHRSSWCLLKRAATQARHAGCNCYRTRIFIAGEMSRTDRALDDARCSADRRASELEGNVNEPAPSSWHIRFSNFTYATDLVGLCRKYKRSTKRSKQPYTETITSIDLKFVRQLFNVFVMRMLAAEVKSLARSIGGQGMRVSLHCNDRV